MITSSDNDRLKLVRKLRDRKWREREGLFATEGEDLLAAGLDSGRAPVVVLVAAGAGIAGVEVEPALLGAASALGSGTRVIAVWELPAGEPPGGGAPTPVPRRPRTASPGPSSCRPGASGEAAVTPHHHDTRPDENVV